jgi:hypothetical protein
LQLGDVGGVVGRNLDVAAATKMSGHPDHATDLANVAFIGAANERAETGPRRMGPSGLGLTLRYNRGSDRVFADGVFADGAFTNRIFANRCRLGHRLRARKVRSNCCSHTSQRHSANDRESQHRSPLAAKVSLELT